MAAIFLVVKAATETQDSVARLIGIAMSALTDVGFSYTYELEIMVSLPKTVISVFRIFTVSLL
jgi:hypothetical protein